MQPISLLSGNTVFGKSAEGKKIAKMTFGDLKRNLAGHPSRSKGAAKLPGLINSGDPDVLCPVNVGTGF